MLIQTIFPIDWDWQQKGWEGGELALQNQNQLNGEVDYFGVRPFSLLPQMIPLISYVFSHDIYSKMISEECIESSYKCGNTEQPARASMACIEEGCNSFALLCGRMGCQCMKPHLRHHIICLEGIVIDVKKRRHLPEEFLKQQKGIDSLLEAWIKELESIRARHQEFIQRYLSKEIKCNSIGENFDKRGGLEAQTVVGDTKCSKMFQDTSLFKISSPYVVSPDQMEEQFKLMKDQFICITQRVEDFWIHNFRFSETLKPIGISLQDNGFQAIHLIGNNFSVCLVEPALSYKLPSKITLKTKLTCIHYALGICVRDIVKSKGYICDNSVDNGCYLLTQQGHILSHSQAIKQREAFVMQSGTQQITVEFDPATNKIIYSKGPNGNRYEQVVVIGPEHKNQLHFCLRVYHTNEGATILQRQE